MLGDQSPSTNNNLSRHSSWSSRLSIPGRSASRPQSQSSMEAPPPYTAAPNAPLSTGPDSPYSFLAQFDTVFLIDDSGSMAGRSWRETSAALEAITPICTEYDSDGVDIYFLNHRNANGPDGGYTSVTSPAAVREIFHSVRPWGGTPTGTRLNHILKPYLARVEAMTKAGPSNTDPNNIVKPLNIIVITDGVPSDDVEAVVVSTAGKLDQYQAEPWQVGIQFFQVGNEPEAAEELRELDDAMTERKGVRDIVDTVPWRDGNREGLSATGILKVVLGSVHRKYDRRDASGRR
ncbi:hypothetical protein FQN54_001202 [Arachnomyces sp. PD_36]|nr:hypothetical protein FQN54_001202 [Arachnomyces sp. PD_36]